MDRKKKLGVVMLLSNADPSVGGAQKQALSLANALQSQGIGVSIVSKQHAAVDKRLSMIRLPTLDLHPGWSFLGSLLVWAFINRKRFQIFHAHTVPIGVTACVIGWLLRKRVIVKIPSMNGVAYFKGSSFSRRVRHWILAKKTTRFVAVSTEIAQALRDTGIPSDKIALIPNGTEFTSTRHASHRAELKQQLCGYDGVQVVLFVGRLVEDKGVDRLLTVWASMPSRERIILLIVGDGPLKASLESRARALELLSTIHFVGHQTVVSLFYEIADLFVLPSRTEGMSNALLEAMAAGVPPMASNVGGNKEIIDDQVNGFLVDWENTKSCVDLLVTLLSNHHLRQDTGAAASRRALTFAMEKIAQHYLRLFRAIL